MSKPSGPECLTLKDLSLYYAGALDDLEVMRIEEHLIGCPDCLDLSERVAESTLEILETEWQPARGLDFLRNAVGAPFVAGLKARLRGWMAGGSDLAVQVGLPKLGEAAATFAQPAIDLMLSVASPFQLAGATASSGSRNAGAEGSLHGQILEIPGAGGKGARLFVDSARQRLNVQIDNVPRDVRPPLAAMHSPGTGATEVIEMRAIESLSADPELVDLIAEFHYEGVADVLVVVEPLEQ